MPKQPRQSAIAPERTMLLLGGSMLTMLGCLQPWGVATPGGPPLRAADTTIGLLIWGLVLLMLGGTILPSQWQRALMLILSGSAGCWLVLWPVQTQAALRHGWWVALAGSAIVFMVALTPPVWWRR